MRRVLIINEGFSSNLGDQAIKKSAIDFYKDNGYEVDFLYLSNPSIKTLPEYEYSPKKNIFKKEVTFKDRLKNYLYQIYWPYKNKKLIKHILTKQNYDVISFGGGQLLNSATRGLISQFALSIYWITKILNEYSPKTKIVYLAVGAHSDFSKAEAYYYKKSLQQASKIWVRDTHSTEVLANKFGVDSIEIPDIAYYVSKNNELPIKENLALIGIANYEEVVARYCPEVSKEQYFENNYKVILDILDENLQLKLFYTTVSDVFTTYEFRDFIKEKGINLEIIDTPSLDVLIQEVKKAQVVISGRMHGLILGQKYGAKVIPYVLSPKLKSFKEKYVDTSCNISYELVDLEL